MQEEVENRTVNLAISSTKLTFRTLLKGYQIWNGRQKQKKAQKSAAKAAKANQKPEGKQSIQELIGQNQGVSSIPIENTEIRDFDRVARKYGIDYAITKDKSVKPPKYTIFFKARDADAVTAAFSEYSNQKLKNRAHPSVLRQLRKLKELVSSIPKKERNKSQERGR